MQPFVKKVCGGCVLFLCSNQSVLGHFFCLHNLQLTNLMDVMESL